MNKQAYINMENKVKDLLLILLVKKQKIIYIKGIMFLKINIMELKDKKLLLDKIIIEIEKEMNYMLRHLL